MNNDDYFNQIESVYKKANKHIRIVSELECNECSLVFSACCAVRNSLHEILIIDNNGQRYRMCKLDDFELTKKNLEEEKAESKRIAEQYEEDKIAQMRQKYDCERTCFECRSNLTWVNRGDFANCGCYISMRVPKNTPPDCAMTCKGFKKK